MNRDIIEQQILAKLKALQAGTFYNSPEQTGTGAEQTLAHGLGTAPSVVWADLTAGDNGAGAAGTLVPVITYGVMDATNLKFTVPAGAKYRVHAVK